MLKRLARLATPLGFLLFFSGFAYLFAVNEDFRKIASKGDNVPIAGMVPIVAFFTWVALREALKHDRIIREGKRDKVLDEMRK